MSQQAPSYFGCLNRIIPCCHLWHVRESILYMCIMLRKCPTPHPISLVANALRYHTISIIVYGQWHKFIRTRWGDFSFYMSYKLWQCVSRVKAYRTSIVSSLLSSSYVIHIQCGIDAMCDACVSSHQAH